MPRRVFKLQAASSGRTKPLFSPCAGRSRARAPFDAALQPSAVVQRACFGNAPAVARLGRISVIFDLKSAACPRPLHKNAGHRCGAVRHCAGRVAAKAGSDVAFERNRPWHPRSRLQPIRNVLRSASSGFPIDLSPPDPNRRVSNSCARNMSMSSALRGNHSLKNRWCRRVAFTAGVGTARLELADVALHALYRCLLPCLKRPCCTN